MKPRTQLVPDPQPPHPCNPEACTLATQYNRTWGWDTEAAATLAHAVLEDANWHGLARVIHNALNPLPRDRVRAAMESMRDHGGGFASALAVAWFRADSDNRKRIELVFADLIRDYAEEGGEP